MSSNIYINPGYVSKEKYKENLKKINEVIDKNKNSKNKKLLNKYIEKKNVLTKYIKTMSKTNIENVKIENKPTDEYLKKKYRDNKDKTLDDNLKELNDELKLQEILLKKNKNLPKIIDKKVSNIIINNNNKNIKNIKKNRIIM